MRGVAAALKRHRPGVRIVVGTSSGANVVAALRVAARLGPGASVATLMADHGLKYLSTDVYRSR